jgi:hypothetical protein
MFHDCRQEAHGEADPLGNGRRSSHHSMLAFEPTIRTFWPCIEPALEHARRLILHLERQLVRPGRGGIKRQHRSLVMKIALDPYMRRHPSLEELPRKVATRLRVYRAFAARRFPRLVGQPARLSRAHPAVDMIRMIGSKNVKFLYCAPHTFYFGDDIGKMIRDAAPVLAPVHVADT